MKHRFHLYRRRGGVYYLQDSETRKQESLKTRDAAQARRLRDARNCAHQQPALSAELGIAYLSAIDPKAGTRTWEVVFTEFASHGGASSQLRRSRAVKASSFDIIRNKKILTTTGDEFRAVLGRCGAYNNHALRSIQHLALGLGWLYRPVIPAKLWPKLAKKEKRAITDSELQKILANEQNLERRLFYRLLWETGSAQSDAASLTRENVDLDKQAIVFRRAKTGAKCEIGIGPSLKEILEQLPETGFLFPTLAVTEAKFRASEFWRKCRQCGIPGISLHSFRYAWAERAARCGLPERFAQAALGHGSKAVSRAYAKRATVHVQPLESFENKNIIPLVAGSEGVIAQRAENHSAIAS